jgi:sarcosine oxidase
MTNFDVVVIGLGGMGSAAAYQLARRGARVLAIEQFGLAHDRGSSHGQTRIIRKAYFEHPDYVPLLIRAYELWDHVAAASGVRLFERCGLLMCGSPAGALISGVRRSAAEHNLRVEELDGDGLRRRFAPFRPGPEMQALFESDAGFLRVEECVRAHAELARTAGADLRFGERVRTWSADGGGVIVETDLGRHIGSKLVICGGAWAGRLLHELSLPLTVRRKVQLWFGPAADAYRLDCGCPAYAFQTTDGFFYGFPSIADGLVKAAEHTGGSAVGDPAALDRALRPDDTPRVAEFVRRHLPGVTPEVRAHAACMYTMTPDEHFVIDRHARHERVIFAAGFSGHGFKFASVTGEVLAELAVESRSSLPIGFLSARRFAAENRSV